MAEAKRTLDTEATLTKSATGWYFLHFSPEIGELFDSGEPTRRLVCTLNGTHSFQCALMPNKGRFSVGVNKLIREKLGLVEGDIVGVRLEPDASKYGAEMPEEFAEVLHQGKHNEIPKFSKLTE